MKVLTQEQERLSEVRSLLGLTDNEINLLLRPKRVEAKTLEVDGEKYPAWRILHNNALGPGKGGIRFHESVTEEEVESLALAMSLKNSLVGLPFGGAKGGVQVRAKELTPEKLEKISRAYIDAFYEMLGENKDIPAPDMYTNSQVMAWMLDQFEKITGRHEPAMITGKPVELGGYPARSSATARGGMVIVKEMTGSLGLDGGSLTFAVQGFGNAGLYIAKMLHESGAKVVAVSDSSGGVFENSGLDIGDVIQIKRDKKELALGEIGQKITNEELLALGVDVLVLAALENQIREDNVDAVKARYVVELANGPITPVADRKLFARSVVVVPDILANAGGVVASYLEWSQNKTGQILETGYLDKKLEDVLRSAWQRTFGLYMERNRLISLRLAAQAIAVKRILTAERLRGRLE